MTVSIVGPIDGLILKRLNITSLADPAVCSRHLAFQASSTQVWEIDPTTFSDRVPLFIVYNRGIGIELLSES